MICVRVSDVQLMMVPVSSPVQEAGVTHHALSCRMDQRQTTLMALVHFPVFVKLYVHDIGCSPYNGDAWSQTDRKHYLCS